jgi:Uri superfamily endonuclease
LHQKQQKTMSGSQFTIFGNKYTMGSYILFIRISSSFQLAFGRFQLSRIFSIPEGDYLYIGSALGRTGNPLARRLIRHASRSSGKKPHEIREAIVKLFSNNDASRNCTIEPTEKKLHWHIDYLLEHAEAEISHIVIIRNPEKIEHNLSEFLSSVQETTQLAPRLGAQDTRNSTHILSVIDRQGILEQLGQYIPILIGHSPMQ